MKRVILIISFLALILIPTKVVEAKSINDYLCGTKNQNELKSRARKIKLTYEFKTDEKNGRYFKIKVANLQDELEIRYAGYTYSKNQDGETFYLMQPFNSNGGTIRLQIYGAGAHACKDQFIIERVIELPKYNPYSEYDECIEYEEFALCNKFYDGEISGTDEFYKKLNEYIDQINKSNVKDKDLSLFESIRIFVEDNQMLCAIIGIILVLAIIAVIIRKIIRKKKRTKVKF